MAMSWKGTPPEDVNGVGQLHASLIEMRRTKSRECFDLHAHAQDQIISGVRRADGEDRFLL
jgi:hypothetical protein